MSNQVFITIYGPQSIIKGPYPKMAVEAVTSYTVEGAEFSKLYRSGKWDGKKHLLKARTGSFATGLVPSVKSVCEENGLEVIVEDKRTEPARRGIWGQPSLELANGWVLRDYQKRMVEATLTHNSGILRAVTGAGKTLASAAVVHARDVNSLVTVPSRELLHQTRKTFLDAIPGATEESIGIVGDSEWQPGTFCTIATISTLHARMDTEECRHLLMSAELLICDEAHMAGSDSWFEVIQACPAYFRYATSGTPFDRTDGGTLRLIGAFGEKISDIGYKELVDSNVLPRANIILDKITLPILPSKGKPKLTYPQVYKQGVVENQVLTDKIVKWTELCVDQGLSVLILVDQIDHGKALDEALWTGAGGKLISHAFVHGSDTGETRSQALIDFEARDLPVLIGSNIFDTGISLNAIDVLILAGSKKSKIRTLQRLGRALRGTKALVIDFIHFTHPFLLSHSQTRYKDYKAEGCFPMHSSSPKAEIIKKAWDSQDR